MHILARFGETAEIDKYLKCTEAEDVNSRDLFGTTSLVWAARNGHDDTVEYLLCTVNADVSAPGFGGWSALQHAVSCSRENMVAILLNHDANPNKADETGSCALHIAAARGAINIVTRLIESHADVNAMNAAGLRPLHYSALFGHASCIKKLIDYGADVDAQDKEGNTALHLAAQMGFETIILLLEGMCDKQISNNDHMTPADLAHNAHIRTLLR
mmetsp:Transcript_17758/g.54632  ORF Transcript_17758/g.54632 Transcript_17758/m.54632 type:complete len:215 (+) Transcript_17758:291-935(+)